MRLRRVTRASQQHCRLRQTLPEQGLQILLNRLGRVESTPALLLGRRADPCLVQINEVDDELVRVLRLDAVPL